MCPSLSLSLQSSKLAAFTFFAKIHPGEVCGSNGLPLTPNSIAILGKAQKLKQLQHPNLCEYLDILRGKHERTIVVSEYIGCTLEDKSKKALLFSQILNVFFQLTNGLHEIHRHGFVAHNLEPKCILIDEFDNVKLFNYGIFYMTNGGEYVSFPIGNIRYMSPERLLGSKNNIKSDVWSIGIIIAELLLQCQLWSFLKISNIIRKIVSLSNSNNIFEKIAREHNKIKIYQELNEDVKELVERCLSINIRLRPMPEDIIKNGLFQTDIKSYKYTNLQKTNERLLCCPLKQIYYLWQLAGGDVQAELKKEGLIRSEAPILSVPRISCLSGQILEAQKSQSFLMDDRIIMLKLSNILERLKNEPTMAYFPLIHSAEFPYKYGTGMEQLPLIIRERDTEYQFHRVMLFTRLLKGYPFTRDLIIKESLIDIPPLLRGQIWACLLDVIRNDSYDNIDKVTPTSTDRQIEVDIPRCHQYDELLSSPEGHHKLKRLLKAWVTSHPQYVYWQGLDSLTAPFLFLNFNDEELAFMSLYKFIPKYLHWFFLKDNSTVIKEYLSKFSQLTAYHEPVLANHLHNINFIPELFAIPWFLTMFSHVFPLHKILHLWDKLILGDNSYPLFIGISVLKQLKSTLLSSGFNECILLFSDLPDIVMENCVIESQKMYRSTPRSICYRQHVLHDRVPGEFDVSNLSLHEIQSEQSPRISANDFLSLYSEHKANVIDLRGSNDYQRIYVPNSINIPFTSISLSDNRLDSLNITDLEATLSNKINVIISNVHENAVLFAKFLVECGVKNVCILHKDFNVLHTVEPNILISS